MNKAVNNAVKRIMKTARKHHDWVFASLAVHMRLDGMEKVKAAMDKMLAELKEQQKEEDDKMEFCDKEIDVTEDNIMVKEKKKEDLENEELDLKNSLSTF